MTRRIGGTAISIPSSQRRPEGDGRASIVALIPVGVLGLVSMALMNGPAEFERLPVAMSPEIILDQPALPNTPINAESVEPAEPVIELVPLPALRQSTDWQFVEVAYGDSLSNLFVQLGLDPADLSLLLRSGDEAKVLNSMKEGNKLALKLDESGRLDEFRLVQSPLQELAFTRSGTEFQVAHVQHTPRIETEIKGGTVYRSLFAAAAREQVPMAQSMRMVDIFGGKIDFMLDTQPGDQFTILYEEQYFQDQYVGDGDILVARFVNRGEEHLAVRYQNLQGAVGYYNPDGNNMQTALMRNPLDVFRISSRFNPRRMHPILNTIRAHEGTDYAAPSGTPVRATSEGRITRASRNGSYGNIVIISHKNDFETRYAHLSRFAEDMEPGMRVRQGEVIGFVGATGSATGPHLHYEVLKNGVPRNPSRANELMPPAPGINTNEMDRFKYHTETLLAQFDAHSQELLMRSAGVSAD